jgi:anaerobic dimethyl sulfoxide reductase subunit A
MLAVLHVMITENLVDRSFIESHSAGFDQLEDYILGLPPIFALQNGGVGGGEAVRGATPAWAAEICGVPAEEIVRFARAYAAAKPAMLLPGFSIQRVYAGEETYRLSVSLQVATGNLGVRGGSTGAINNRLPGPRLGGLDIPPLPDLPELPVLRWPDAVLQGRRGGYPSDIHAIYNLGANSINQGADIRKAIAAFEAVDFSVCHEMFMTPTARYCDVILPVSTALEREDIASPWLGNYLLYKPQVVPPRGQARSDYDILCDLAERLGFGAEFSGGRSAAEWITHFIEQSVVPDPQEFRRSGIYLAPDQERVGLADFSADPQRFPLSTPSGKVEIASELYQRERGFPAIPTWQAPPEDARYPLRLITPKSPYRTHSQGSNIPAVRRKAAHALVMHPQDAAARGITDGDTVRLFNAQGESHIRVQVTEDITPGAECLPEGVWAALNASGVDTAGSANMLTSTDGTRASTAAIMHGIGVQVEKCTSNGSDADKHR